MKIDSVGENLIKSSEEFTPQVKNDFGGKQEIGWGHDLLPGETFPEGIDETEGEILFQHDVEPVEDDLNLLLVQIGAEINQNQFNALVDFGYECGIAALKMLLSHGISQVPKQLPRWIYAHRNGSLVKLDGMVIRRQKEVNLWNGITQS